jgi:hypothetical protein
MQKNLETPKISISKSTWTEIDTPQVQPPMKKVHFWPISVLDPQFGGHRSQEDGLNFIR